MNLVIDYILEYTIICGLSLIMVLIYSIVQLVKYSRAMNFRSYVLSLSPNVWRSRYLEHVMDKINKTNLVIEKRIAAEDVVAQSIYDYNVVKQLGQDLSDIFESQYSKISSQYSELTSLDLLVLALLGMEMNNAEICSVLRMERRTLYRRRQLIAQRIGISSTDLESFSEQMFGNESDPISF